MSLSEFAKNASSRKVTFALTSRLSVLSGNLFVGKNEFKDGFKGKTED